jgi:hypothetical protein
LICSPRTKLLLFMDDPSGTSSVEFCGVVSAPGSVLTASLRTTTLQDLAASLPADITVVVPTSLHRVELLSAWVQQRSGADLPNVTTMATLVTDLSRFISDTLPRIMPDSEVELLMDLAVREAGEVFSPPAFTTSRIMRFKQELMGLRRVQHDLDMEDRPADLYDVDRFLRVWASYEARKSGLGRDRADVSMDLADALANGRLEWGKVPVDRRTIFVSFTHGLTHVDRTILHLLARAGFDVGIQFARHVDLRNRSNDDGRWLVGHGWEPIEEERSSFTFQCIEAHPDSPRAEVREALAYFKRETGKGHDPSDVCLIIPNDGSYDDVVADISAMADVPTTLNRPMDLATTADACALYAACSVISSRWDRDDILRLVRSPALNVPVPLARLAEASMMFRILGGEGSDQWRRRLEAMQSTLMQSLEDDAASDTLRALKLTREALTCVDLLRSALPAAGEIDADAFIGRLTHIAQTLGITVSTDLRSTWDRYRSIALYHRLGTLSFDHHVAHWWSLVRRTTIIPPHTVGGLTVARPHEVRGRSFGIVAAVGMVNGVLPSRPPEALDEVVLAGMAEAIDRETLSDIVFAVREHGTLRLSRPRVAGKDPTVASPYLAEVAARAQDHIMDPSHPDTLLTAADVQAYVSGVMIDHRARQVGLTLSDLPSNVQHDLREADGSTVSPSRLDLYRSCPYRYYVQRLLGESESLRFDETLSPLERGSLMHRIAHVFFRQRQGDHGTSHDPPASITVEDVEQFMVDLTTHNVEDLLSQLVDIYHQQRERYPRGYLYDDVEHRSFLDTSSRAGILRRWLLREIEHQQAVPFRPILFELPIEMDVAWGEHQLPVKLRIDRVDAYVDSGLVHLAVIDYKTTSSSVPTLPAILSGRSTQMPLYLAAIKEWFAGRGLDVCVESSDYHTFGRSVFDPKDPRIVKSARADQLPEIMPNILPTIDGIRSGRFPVLPEKGACDRCHLHEVCRVEQWGPLTNDEQGSDGKEER